MHLGDKWVHLPPLLPESASAAAACPAWTPDSSVFSLAVWIRHQPLYRNLLQSYPGTSWHLVLLTERPLGSLYIHGVRNCCWTTVWLKQWNKSFFKITYFTTSFLYWFCPSRETQHTTLRRLYCFYHPREVQRTLRAAECWRTLPAACGRS